NERRREAEEQIIDVVALLGAHLEDVAEAPSGEQSEFGTFALDEGVGYKRRSVDNAGDIGEADARAADNVVEPLERANRGITRGRKALMEGDSLAIGVVKDEVGERAANIESNMIAVEKHFAGTRFSLVRP